MAVLQYATVHFVIKEFDKFIKTTIRKYVCYQVSKHYFLDTREKSYLICCLSLFVISVTEKCVQSQSITTEKRREEKRNYLVTSGPNARRIVK